MGSTAIFKYQCLATKLWILWVLNIEPIHLSSIFSMVGNIHLKLHVFANDPSILHHCFTRERKKKANSSQQGEGVSKSQQTYDARYPTIWPMVDGPGNRFLESLFAWLISYNVRRTRDERLFFSQSTSSFSQAWRHSLI